MNKIIFGDCRRTMRELIAQGVKVQMCVTSPPYFGLRDYGTAAWEGGDPDCPHSVGGQVQDNKAPGAITTGVRPGVDASKCRKCGAKRVDLQIGLEQTPDEYVAAMVEVFSLVWYLLADDGVLWLNLGDSYVSAGGGGESRMIELYGADSERCRGVHSAAGNGQKSGGKGAVAGLRPKNLLGIPWRVAFALQAAGWYLRQDIIWHKPNPMPESVTDRCTKAHEYLFLLSKSERYYFDNEAIKEPSVDPVGSADRYKSKFGGKKNEALLATDQVHTRPIGMRDFDGTRNRRSVWTIATTPYTGAHFATFPPALIEPCILAGSRVGDVVLDPFMGSGTTAQVAIKLGRKYLGCELNPAYAGLQNDRTAQDAFVF